MPAYNQVLNFDAPEPHVAVTSNASALFPAAPIYARPTKARTSSNLPMLVGAPIALVAAGALAWTMMANPTPTAPAAEPRAQMAVTDTAPLTPPLAPAAEMPAPTQIAVNEALAPSAIVTPARVAPRAAVARRAAAPAAVTAPVANPATAEVSATVPAP
ncbi:MAG: hypothetical protein PSX79_14225, partial [bacterium]|nr:hypothetical protein [bacterium]